MVDNLPEDFRDVEQQSIVGEDSRSLPLTHYVLAERLLQVEYATIAKEIRDQAYGISSRAFDRAYSGGSETLIYILEGGFRGFHKYSSGEMWAEWKDSAAEKWYDLYESSSLPWPPYEEDPILKQGEDLREGDSD